MCMFGGNPAEKAAKEARQREEARQGRIAAGKTRINEAFAGFDDDFYGGRETAYSQFARPEIEDQYNRAKHDLTLALSRSGNLNSSTASRRSSTCVRMTMCMTRQHDRCRRGSPGRVRPVCGR